MHFAAVDCSDASRKLQSEPQGPDLCHRRYGNFCKETEVHKCIHMLFMLGLCIVLANRAEGKYLTLHLFVLHFFAVYNISNSEHFYICIATLYIAQFSVVCCLQNLYASC